MSSLLNDSISYAPNLGASPMIPLRIVERYIYTINPPIHASSGLTTNDGENHFGEFSRLLSIPRYATLTQPCKVDV
jgi:hypothetical protein